MTPSPSADPQAGGTTASRRKPRALGRGLILAVGLVVALAGPIPASAAPPASTDPSNPDLGANVVVFDPSMSTSSIQAAADSIYAQQVDNEMGTARYALLFKPGVYGTSTTPLQLKVGYYTEVAGLGAAPSDVTINGKVEVYNRCLDNGGTSNCLALVNFWRTLSNLTINVNSLGQDGCRASANFWAVSQAVSVRRVVVNGATFSLMDYCTAGPQFASGGFIADSKAGTVLNGSQQQWLTRNSQIGSWTNGVWNAVFAGVDGRPVRHRVPQPAVHDAGHHAGEPREAVPVHRRRRPVQRPRPVGPDELERRHLGRRSDARPDHPAVRLLRGATDRPGTGDQQPALPRPQPHLHAGRVRHREDHRCQARGYGRARPRPGDPHRRQRRRAGDRGRRPRRDPGRPHHRRRYPELAGTPAGRQAERQQPPQ